jgi:osmotically-inducible protein OsmY
MIKICKGTVIFISSFLLSSCLGGVLTGANLFYDRHHVFKKTTDISLAAQVGHAIKLEPSLACANNRCFEIAAFHGDVLLLGVVDEPEKKNKATAVAKTIQGMRHLYNYIEVDPQMNTDININDHWITTQIRSQIIADSDIDPAPFKVVSHHQVVYFLGDVFSSQEKLIIDIAKDTAHVNKVVNLMQIYTLTHQPKKLPPTQNFNPSFQDPKPLVN